MQELKSPPFDISGDITDIIATEQLCPGVYYVAGRRAEDGLGVECYAVDTRTAPLSMAAKSYGVPSQNDAEILLYRLDDPASGRSVVKYEVQKYRSQAQLPSLEDENVLETAVYGMEYHPEYFGDYPVPLMTPRGATVRHKRLASGIYVLETDSFERMIAVCYPVWSTDLSDYTVAQAEQLDSDLQQGIDNTLGYLFFPESAGCLVLFELWRWYDAFVRSGIVKRAELMNAIYMNHPEYTVMFNRSEQDGANDIGAHIWRLLGYDVEPEGEEDNLLRLDPSVGADYLVF